VTCDAASHLRGAAILTTPLSETDADLRIPLNKRNFFACSVITKSELVKKSK